MDIYTHLYSETAILPKCKSDRGPLYWQTCSSVRSASCKRKLLQHLSSPLHHIPPWPEISVLTGHSRPLCVHYARPLLHGCAVLSVGTPKTYIHPENLLKRELWWSILRLHCKGTVFMLSVLYSGHLMTSAHLTVLLGSGRLQGRGGFLIIEGDTDLLTFPTPCPSWAVCSCKYNVCPVGDS